MEPSRVRLRPGEVALSVVFAEDNYLLREGTAALLTDAEDVTLAASVSDLRSLLSAVEEHRPYAVLTDIRMPPDNAREGIEAAHLIRQRHPTTGVLVLSQHSDDEYAHALLEHGAAHPPEGRHRRHSRRWQVGIPHDTRPSALPRLGALRTRQGRVQPERVRCADVGNGQPQTGWNTADQRIADWTAFAQDPQWVAGANCVQACIALGAGWEDHYRWQRTGQYVPLDPGEEGDGLYVIRLQVNAAGGIAETTTEDNTSYALVHIRGGAVEVCERGLGDHPWAANAEPIIDAWPTLRDGAPTTSAGCPSIKR